MAPTTPIGSRTIRELATVSPPAKSAATRALGATLVNGMPTSWVMRWARSSIRVANACETWVNSSVRFSTGVADQAGNAARAAATARSTSLVDPSGMDPITSSVVESMTSMVPFPVEGTHSPPMYKRSRTIGCEAPMVIPLLEVMSPQLTRVGHGIFRPPGPGGPHCIGDTIYVVSVCIRSARGEQGSGMTQTQGERKAETRARLLAAGADLFADRGMDAVSVDAVAEAAGRPSGAVYAHFGSKQGLLLAVLDAWKQSVLTVLFAEVAMSDSPLGQLAAVWDNMGNNPDTDSDRWSLLEHELWQRAARDPEVADALRVRSVESRGRSARELSRWASTMSVQPVADPDDLATR